MHKNLLIPDGYRLDSIPEKLLLQSDCFLVSGELKVLFRQDLQGLTRELQFQLIRWMTNLHRNYPIAPLPG